MTADTMKEEVFGVNGVKHVFHERESCIFLTEPLGHGSNEAGALPRDLSCP
jgi:hypothetical protein